MDSNKGYILLSDSYGSNCDVISFLENEGSVYVRPASIIYVNEDSCFPEKYAEILPNFINSEVERSHMDGKN